MSSFPMHSLLALLILTAILDVFVIRPHADAQRSLVQVAAKILRQSLEYFQYMIIKIGYNKQVLPLQPIRILTPGWAGAPVKIEDGAPIQPFHCLPFVEGSTYGLELVYPYETECHVVNDHGDPRFDWDFMKEPGGALDGSEFIFFSPIHKAKYYLFNTKVDVQPPPGYVIRTEPHPRFYTDDAGTVPMPMVGHLQNEWYSRQLFVVFRAPRTGQRHVFRKDEPYAQLLFVPQEMTYEITRMSPEEEASRQEMTKNVQFARNAIATKRWYNSTNNEQDNHYKVLAAAFAKGGQAEVEQKVREGVDRQKLTIPHDKSIAECMAMGRQHLQSSHFQKAASFFSHVLKREPNNAEALNCCGICLAITGNVRAGLSMMAQAVALQPHSSKLHRDLGEMLRVQGQLQQAEVSLRTALSLNPNNPDILSLLGLTQTQQGRLAEGLEACQTAVNIAKMIPAAQSMIPNAYYRLGFVLGKLGKKNEARASLEAALALDPKLIGTQCLGMNQAEVDAILG